VRSMPARQWRTSSDGNEHCRTPGATCSGCCNRSETRSKDGVRNIKNQEPLRRSSFHRVPQPDRLLAIHFRLAVSHYPPTASLRSAPSAMACRIAFVFFCSPLSSATDRPSRRTTTRCEPSTSSSISDEIMRTRALLRQFGDEPLDLPLHQRRYRESARRGEEVSYSCTAIAPEGPSADCRPRVRGSARRRSP